MSQHPTQGWLAVITALWSSSHKHCLSYVYLVHYLVNAFFLSTSSTFEFEDHFLCLIYLILSFSLCISLSHTPSLFFSFWFSLSLRSTHSFFIDGQGINFERELLLSPVLWTLPSHLLASEDLRRVLARRCAVIDSSNAKRVRGRYTHL